VLPRQPGTKESRYAHLLGGDVVEVTLPAQPIPQVDSNAGADRIAKLEEEVSELRRELGGLRDQMERFRKQFE